MSPKAKRELARQHLETAQSDLGGGRHGDALNAMFHAAEAAAVWLAERHGIATEQKHWLKAGAVSDLHERGIVPRDFGPLLRQLNQARKDYWYEGEDPDPDDLEAQIAELGELVQHAEAVE